MPLVAYSDSENSDTEPTSPRPAPPKPAAKDPTFTKTSTRKIKVDLPTLQPEEEDAQRPVKKARTAGAFSGFNSLLPAPKAQTGPRAGVSLRTSAEAAFSRAPVEDVGSVGEDGDGVVDGEGGGGGEGRITVVAKEEPKIVGKATKFRPLSVANSRKKAVKKGKPVRDANGIDSRDESRDIFTPDPSQDVKEAEPPPKLKRSLFSVPGAEDATPAPPAANDIYEPITTSPPHQEDPSPQLQPCHPSQPHPPTNSLQTLATDLNLTQAEQRQLFGRNHHNPNISITHFDMEAEYASNERLRQEGEVVEHRAVKAIAPGKHSLQQLVNNARSQREGLEDKWADGRRERGGGGGGR